jgi:hypothetical protein
VEDESWLLIKASNQESDKQESDYTTESLIIIIVTDSLGEE